MVVAHDPCPFSRVRDFVVRIINFLRKHWSANDEFFIDDQAPSQRDNDGRSQIRKRIHVVSRTYLIHA